MAAEITGIGWITADGMGCAKDRDAFVMADGLLPVLTPRAIFKEPYSPFRRMDEYSKLGIAAVAFALKDACLDEWTEKRKIGIIASTEYGCLGTDMDYFDTVMPANGVGASPALFSYTLSSIFLGEAAIAFGLTGTTFIINEKTPFGLTGLELALGSLFRGEEAKMLSGVCNPICPPDLEKVCRVPAGALFLVIETIPAKGSSYGKLSLSKEGRVEFNKKAVPDLSELVRRCLAERR